MPQLHFSKQSIEVKNFHCPEVNIIKEAECARDWQDGFQFTATIQDNPNLASFRRDIYLEYKQKQLAVESAFRRTIYGTRHQPS